MLRHAIAALTLTVGLATPCLAQQTYVPVTIDEQQFQAIQNYLGEQPNKFAGPMVNMLNNLEVAAQTAKAEADADAAKAKSETPPQ